MKNTSEFRSAQFHFKVWVVFTLGVFETDKEYKKKVLKERGECLYCERNET